MTDAGSLLRLNARRSFRQATERLDGLARSVPDNKDNLAEDQEIGGGIWEGNGKPLIIQ